MIDKVFGIRLGIIIFAACIATGKSKNKEISFVIATYHYMPSQSFFLSGQALTTLGCFIDIKAVVYLGRFVFGLGSENLEVACSTFSSSWFSGTALNMAFGFQLASFKVGSAVSLMVLGPIYDAFFPEECVFEGATSVDPDAITLPTTAFITNQTIMNSTSNPRDCKKEENLALGWTMTVACSCVVLCLVGALIAGLLDKIRSKYILTKVEEQPKVLLIFNIRWIFSKVQIKLSVLSIQLILPILLDSTKRPEDISKKLLVGVNNLRCLLCRNISVR